MCLLQDLLQHAKGTLDEIDAWLVILTNTLAQDALNRGDLNRLRSLITTWQTGAPDLVVQFFGDHAVWYVEGIVNMDRLATILTAGSLPKKIATSGVARPTGVWQEVIQGLWTGHVVVLTRHQPGAMLLNLAKPPQRDIGEPHTEQSIRGPQEAFVEPAGTKLAQLRHRLPSPNLEVTTFTLGRRFPVRCDLIYCRGIASEAVVHTMQERIQQLDVDTITNVTRLGSFIRDQPWSLFPTVRYSERVDWIALQLESGKVALSVDGDPFVLTAPANLMDFYRTSEDYSSAWYDTSFMRIIRIVAWAFGVMLPGWYIALTEVNPDLISPTLFDIVSGSHTGLPFTPIVEVVVMILVIEILREAAVRLPTVLATTIGTVGAIVVGTAVVKAGFVSPQIIVLMTFTALSLFSVPTYELLASWRFTSWAVLLLAFVLGIYGIALVTLALSIELVALTSFGTPYLMPWSPWRPKDWLDTLWRVPWRSLPRRSTAGREADLKWQEEI